MPLIRQYEVTIRLTVLVEAMDEDDASVSALELVEFGADVTSSGVEDIRLIGE